ncbi:MAG: prepilin-type N-terminal cleavage/methylation domain-containing protein [Nitrospira sp.]|nr:prepilin-type N-terminal cleavage/methylation domain-containing protein [Nitrospira sp.]
MAERLTNQSRLKKTDGSSLLEVLVALVLVSVVLLGISGFSTVSIKGTAFSQKMTRAATIAQDALEEVRRIGYRSSVSGVTTDREPYGSIVGAPAFERVVVIEANTPSQGVQKTTVTVRWDAGAHSLSLTTLVAE